MSLQTQIIITGVIIVCTIIICIAIYRDMRKQDKAWQKKQEEERQQSITEHYPRKKKKKSPPPVELTKNLCFKRPGPAKGVTWYNKRELVRKHLVKNRITFSDFEIISLSYTEYTGKNKPKKAQGYWKFSIVYG